MSFNSVTFFVFLAVVYPLYFALKDYRKQNWMLLAASYYFYGSWDYRFLGLMFFATAIDYWVALRLEDTADPRKRKLWLLLSLVTNLGILGFFKYFGFFVDSFVALFEGMGISIGYRAPSIVLPVGISFYTFQTLSYTIDVYRRRCAVARNFRDFALFVSFFPQLVAGPIERATELLPRLSTRRTVTHEDLTRGAFLVLLGMMKKVAVADGFAPVVDSVFNADVPTSSLEVLLASYAFCIQIYCDFSAYSDIARGVSKTLGVPLMLNFNMPLFATTPSDFWRRWHISFSTWLRDYLYIPLGGNRKGEARTHWNIFVTFFLGGLWHGAAWNFVIWGIYNGILVSLWRVTKFPIKRVLSNPFLAVINFVLHFQTIAYGRLLFRANSMDQVVLFTQKVFGGWGDHGLARTVLVKPNAAAVLGLVCVLGFDLCWHRTGDDKFYQRWPRFIRTAMYAAFLLVILMGAGNPPQQFIYFQF